MLKTDSLQLDTVLTFKAPQFMPSELDLENIAASATKQSQSTPGNQNQIDTLTKCVSLKLEGLKCFEKVENQFKECGVIFSNCMAIQPSNPAFPPRSGSVVLMGSPQSGSLEVFFLNPVKLVRAFITSSQRLILSAYDRDGRLLTQSVLPSANLANSDSCVSPNKLLFVSANNIHSVSFCAFDGQFTVDDFNFCI